MKSLNDAIFSILIGTGIVLFGIFNKTFYAGKGISAAALSDKQIPIWQGRLIFLLVGGMYLFFGIYYFVSKIISE